MSITPIPPTVDAPPAINLSGKPEKTAPAVDLDAATKAAAEAEAKAAEARQALAVAEDKRAKANAAKDAEVARRKRIWATTVLRTLKADLDAANKERAAATTDFQTAVREGGNILLAFHRVTETHARVWSLRVAGAKAVNYVPELTKIDLRQLGLMERSEPVFNAPDFAMTLAEALRLVAAQAETTAAATALAGLRALDQGGEA